MEPGCDGDFMEFTETKPCPYIILFLWFTIGFCLPVHEWSPVICPSKEKLYPKWSRKKGNLASNITPKLFVQVGATMLEFIVLHEVALGFCTDLLATGFRGWKIKLNLCSYLSNHQRGSCLCSLMGRPGQGVAGAKATEGPAGTWQSGPWTSQDLLERLFFALAKTS